MLDQVRSLWTGIRDVRLGLPTLQSVEGQPDSCTTWRLPPGEEPRSLDRPIATALHKASPEEMGH